MLDPTQKYECDAGEVIALHGPDVDGDFCAIVRTADGDILSPWVLPNGHSNCGDEQFDLRPARPKLHVKCWLVVWDIGGGVESSAFDAGEKALEYAQCLRTGRCSVAILPIDTTLTAGDGMEEQS